jgi:hypothetical protein
MVNWAKENRPNKRRVDRIAGFFIDVQDNYIITKEYRSVVRAYNFRRPV